jgi:hypothetical protein
MSTTIEITLDDRTTAALDSLKSAKGQNREEVIKSIIIDYATLKSASFKSFDQKSKVVNEKFDLASFWSFYCGYTP